MIFSFHIFRFFKVLLDRVTVNLASAACLTVNFKLDKRGKMVTPTCSSPLEPHKVCDPNVEQSQLERLRDVLLQ